MKPPEPHQKILDYYAAPGDMTSLGAYAEIVRKLPDDISELVRIVQGLIVYEYVAADFYGFTIPKERLAESHIRNAGAMLERILALSDEPLTRPRPPEKRLVGVCHHFVVLLVAILRAKGMPARDRWGFGTYFNPGYYEDHVTCEYWHADSKNWRLADVQFDETWRKALHIEHDILDVPRDRFILAHDAWQRCRSGNIPPDKIGIFKGDLRGLWFAAGSLVRDAASLNKMEMLQWDVWGAIPHPDEQLGDSQLAFFDHLADLIQNADSSFKDIHALYGDEHIRVPAAVFNAVLNQTQRVAA